MQVRNRKNNLTNSSKSPLIVTKQQGKNNTASGQKPHALCLCERCCHDSVFFCAQCHSQHQRARASKIQKPQSMELWKNWWKTTSWSLSGATCRGVRRRGVGSTHHPHQQLPAQTLLSDEPRQPGRYQPRCPEAIPGQGESQNSQITNTSAANERDHKRVTATLHSLRPKFAF